MAQPSTLQLSLNQAVIGADLAPIKQIQIARFDVEPAIRFAHYRQVVGPL
jgi:hypothetical protein